MRPAERLLERLEGVKATGDRRWQARCPAHDDRSPSLVVTEKASGDVLLHCHAGCQVDDVLAEVELSTADLFAEQRNGNGHREIVATYDYTDEQGELLFQVVRFAPKDFRQRRPDGAGGWDWKLGDVRRVLYRLPRVLEGAKRGEGVYVVEGEKDVHALEERRVIATCNPGGAGKWRGEYAEALRGAQVVVIADRDDTGREHAFTVAKSLEGIAASVDVVEPTRGKDIAEHFAAGGSLGQVRELEAEKFLCTTKGSAVLQRNSIGNLPIAPLPEVVAAAPAEPDWRWEGYLSPGALTLLAGRPKVGKSTLIFALVAALTTGRSFLGRAVREGGVLILSEERRDSIAEKARAFGLDDGTVHVLMRHEAHGTPWSEIVVEARTYCRAHGLGVLVVDTFDKWTGLRGDDENKSGPVLEALDPLARAAGDDLAVLISSHQRKADGNYGEAVRGSNALTGGVDVIVELERPPASAQAGGSARVLNAVSRFGATPEELAVELDDGTYRACGDLAALKAEAEDQKLVDVLTDHSQSVNEIAELTDLGTATVRRRLDAKADRGDIDREGAGKRGDPYRYRRRQFLCNTTSPIGVAINSEPDAAPLELGEVA